MDEVVKRHYKAKDLVIIQDIGTLSCGEGDMDAHYIGVNNQGEEVTVMIQGRDMRKLIAQLQAVVDNCEKKWIEENGELV